MDALKTKRKSLRASFMATVNKLKQYLVTKVDSKDGDKLYALNQCLLYLESHSTNFRKGGHVVSRRPIPQRGDLCFHPKPVFSPSVLSLFIAAHQ